LPIPGRPEGRGSAASADLIRCDVEGVVRPDIHTVDALARLQLQAVQAGRRICFDRASADLRALVELCGLATTLPTTPAGSTESSLGVESGRQPEQREEPLRVEEERDRGDALAVELQDLE
jgi:hypothetical protein